MGEKQHKSASDAGVAVGYKSCGLSVFSVV